MQLIPTTSDPYYSQRVRMSGVDYLLRFRWNSRQELWRLDMLTDEEEPLVLGFALVCGVPLLEYYRHINGVPPGELMAVSSVADISPAGLNELGEGKRVELYYLEPVT